VTICAGAMSTPGILMRSGIGDPVALAALGLPTRVPLPGVGANFMDHPTVTMWAVPKPGSAHLGEPMRQVLLRHTSGLTDHRNDLHVCMLSGMSVDMYPALRTVLGSTLIGGLSVGLMASRSRGRVWLTSPDPYARPHVAVGCLTNRADIAPLTQGIRLAWRLMQHPQVQAHLDGVHAWTAAMVHSDAALDRAVAAFVRPSAHACGTARMGRSPESGAVVTPQGRVHGVDNLWVADASIMPTIPSAPTNLTCIMIAEKIAAGLRGGAHRHATT
jgi:choline dehydrogenase